MAAQLLHTPEEAAELLRCTAWWLTDKARRREIPFTFVSGAYRFSDAHLEQIIAIFEQAPQRQPGQAEAGAPRRKTTAAAAPSPEVTHLKARPPRRRIAS